MWRKALCYFHISIPYWDCRVALCKNCLLMSWQRGVTITACLPSIITVQIVSLYFPKKYKGNVEKFWLRYSIKCFLATSLQLLGSTSQQLHLDRCVILIYSCLCSNWFTRGQLSGVSESLHNSNFLTSIFSFFNIFITIFFSFKISHTIPFFSRAAFICLKISA